MPRIHHHDDRRHKVRNGKKHTIWNPLNSWLDPANAFGQKGVAAIGRAVLQKIDRDHDEHGRLQKGLPKGDLLISVQLLRFVPERAFEVSRALPWRSMEALRG